MTPLSQSEVEKISRELPVWEIRIWEDGSIERAIQTPSWDLDVCWENVAKDHVFRGKARMGAHFFTMFIMAGTKERAIKIAEGRREIIMAKPGWQKQSRFGWG